MVSPFSVFSPSFNFLSASNLAFRASEASASDMLVSTNFFDGWGERSLESPRCNASDGPSEAKSRVVENNQQERPAFDSPAYARTATMRAAHRVRGSEPYASILRGARLQCFVSIAFDVFVCAHG